MVGADPFGGCHRRALVAVIFQNIVYMAVLAGADLRG